jgi:Ca-activated chloride channel homolog
LWLASTAAAFGQLPFINAGPDSGFAQIDFAQLYLDNINRRQKLTAKQEAQDKELVDSGTVSALDLEAPNNAIEEYNRAKMLAHRQDSKEAIRHLQKAVSIYPKFVSAHVGLALAYVDQGNQSGAKSEFESAEKLDAKFPGTFLNFGLFSLSLQDYATAESQLEKAASLHPRDVKTLSALAYAQNGTHQYRQALQTSEIVHGLEHKGQANVHYVAAAAAMALKDYDAMERELTLFVDEDPTNALAPVAHKNLDAIANNKRLATANGASQPAPGGAPGATQTFPNSERLRAQLSGLGTNTEAESCDSCSVTEKGPETSDALAANRPAMSQPTISAGGSEASWTIRTSVDQVAVFFSASSRGHMVDNVQQSEVQIRDNNKPPERILQFAPQSKLPLRLALLVDTSGSVKDRFSFEKQAAKAFLKKILLSNDLAFIAGFSNETSVMQDFSADQGALGTGIEKLSNGGGTSLFDAATYACWKLGEYPDDERVARVLVILSDGEDNSSHGTLKQSVQAAERTGVTVYTVSTREGPGDKTDADRILEAMAESSGGEALFPLDMATLDKSFDRLRELIRDRYFIAYKPADFRPDGSYRSISITAQKNGKRLQVRSRKGYHARIEATPN